MSLQTSIDDSEAIDWFAATVIVTGPAPSEDGWKTLKYNLQKYAGRTVTALVKSGFGGKHPWNNDRVYFDEISVVVD
jgi:hypothetical protein